MLAKQCSKFYKPGFNSKWTMNFQMFKLDLQRQRNQRSNCQHPLNHRKSKRIPEKHLLLLHFFWMDTINCGKPFFWMDTINCGKFLKRWGYQTTLPASCETCMQVKKQQLKWDMEQQTGSKLGKEYIKAAYGHPAYLTYIQSTSCEIPGWMNHKVESRFPWEISTTSDMQMTPPLWQKEKRK